MKKLLLLLVVMALSVPSFAGEGMWLPLLLKQLNEAEMQSMGMKMTAEDIYSVNNGSLKDAIVHFGGFCTGEVISDQGLVLTNHHCGYRQIQSHTTLEDNYLRDGFWAKTLADEKPNPGLFVTFIVKIEDVTAQILEGVTASMNAQQRQIVIERNIGAFNRSYKTEAYQKIMIRPFFKGNQYFLFVTETYNDIRLVGAPPSSIGKFGADTDNWEWPRHTGDFSLFRIYAGPDNKPADYSPDNKPFQPRYSLPISLDGVEEDDFTLVFGFPGRTDEYLPATAVAMRVDVLNPIKIGIRDEALKIIDAQMRADEGVRIKYASKQAGIANAWKKWIGESQGVKATDGIGKKQALEAEFKKRVSANPDWKAAYGNILPNFDDLYNKIAPFAQTQAYVGEIAGRNIEVFRLANILHRYVRIYENNGAEGFEKRRERLVGYLGNFYKDYEASIDQDVFTALIGIYFDKVQQRHLSKDAMKMWAQAGKSYEKLGEYVFSKSKLTSPQFAIQAAKEKPEQLMGMIKNDPAYQLCRAILEHNDEVVSGPYNTYDSQLQALQSTYMKALMDVFPEKRFYPDANSTMRVTYGQVKGYMPKDAIVYQP
ncbi:MAG: S46 family peptidase, partial [Bacteroidota bacterium]